MKWMRVIKSQAIIIASLFAIFVLYASFARPSKEYTPNTTSSRQSNVDHSHDEENTFAMNYSLVASGITGIEGGRASGNSFVMQVSSDFLKLGKPERNKIVREVRAAWRIVLKPANQEDAKVVVIDSTKSILPETYIDY